MYNISKGFGLILLAFGWLMLSAPMVSQGNADDTLDEKDMRRYIELMFNGKHIEAIETYYAEDVVLESELLGNIQGRDKIKSLLDGYFKLVKEQHIPATIIINDNESAIELLSTMVVLVDHKEHKAGDTWKARFNMHYSFEGNKIKRASIYTLCKPCSQDQMKIPHY